MKPPTTTVNQSADSQLYVTSDEHVFFEKEKAIAHAHTLEDRRIKSLNRQEAEMQAAALENNLKEDDMDSFLDGLTEL